jgi:hypothetical protein
LLALQGNMARLAFRVQESGHGPETTSLGPAGAWESGVIPCHHHHVHRRRGRYPRCARTDE